MHQEYSSWGPVFALARISYLFFIGSLVIVKSGRVQKMRSTNEASKTDQCSLHSGRSRPNERHPNEVDCVLA